MTPERSRLASLDGLRGLAACGVAFLYHPLLKVDPAIMDSAPVPLVWLRMWGWTFVDLFFLISGYIFAHVYLEAGPSGGGIERARTADFAVARIARLYPLHLLMLLVCAVMFAGNAGNTWPVFVAHLFMMQGFVGNVSHTFDGPSWSISVEIVCYLVFVLAAVRGDRTLRRVTACVVALALAHFVLRGMPGGPWIGDSVPRGLLGFFLGQMLWRRRADLVRVPAVLLVLALALGLTADTGVASSLLPICLLAWPSALALALRMPILASRAMVWLGDRSYAVYLIHFPVLLVFDGVLKSAQAGWMAGAIIVGYGALVLGLSDLAYRCFELPARSALRTAWERRTRATASAA